MPEASEARSYPVSLSLTGRRVVVAGGGKLATQRVAELVASGAQVEVVAPRLSPELESWARRGTIAASLRPFAATDLDGAWLAFAATDDPQVNEAVVIAALERRCFVSGGADGRRGNCRPLAVLRRGDLEVAVGTSGRSPAVSAWMRRRLESDLGPEYGTLVDLAAEARDDLRQSGRAVSSADWCAALNSGILDLIRTGQLRQAREGLRTCLSLSSE
jgi:siroheme synthase-like protein